MTLAYSLYSMSLNSSTFGRFTNKNKYSYVKQNALFDDHFGNPLCNNAKAKINWSVRSAKSAAPFFLPSTIVEFTDVLTGSYWNNLDGHCLPNTAQGAPIPRTPGSSEVVND